ncbi:MAG: right-handed parallel beta-helix repeat-containing protein [Gaiellaceae bacterium]
MALAAGSSRGHDLYVSPGGSIQAALDRAQPGTTIHLAPGTYRETLHTVRDGTAAAPITIRGPESAVLTGTGRVVSVDNSHYRFVGFTVDGEPALSGVTFPASLGAARAFKDGVQTEVAGSKLVYVGSDDAVRGVHDVVLRRMLLRRSGGECVRIRNDAYDVTVTESTIEWCGLQGTGDDVSGYRYHNGEGVYIGTSPRSSGQPLAGRDTTSHVLISGNTIETYGAECVDVKELAHDNTIVGNLCADDDEPARFSGSLVELRAYANSVERNTFVSSRGYGVRIASDDPARYPVRDNDVRGNTFSRIAADPVLASGGLLPGEVCGNGYRGPAAPAGLLAEVVAPCH